MPPRKPREGIFICLLVVGWFSKSCMEGKKALHVFPCDLYAACGQGGDLLEDGGRDVDGANGADGTLVDNLGGCVEISLRDLDHLAACVGRAVELPGGNRDNSVRVGAGLAA